MLLIIALIDSSKLVIILSIRVGNCSIMNFSMALSSVFGNVAVWSFAHRANITVHSFVAGNHFWQLILKSEWWPLPSFAPVSIVILWNYLISLKIIFFKSSKATLEYRRDHTDHHSNGLSAQIKWKFTCSPVIVHIKVQTPWHLEFIHSSSLENGIRAYCGPYGSLSALGGCVLWWLSRSVVNLKVTYPLKDKFLGKKKKQITSVLKLK